jgi:hypothetical protein
MLMQQRSFSGEFDGEFSYAEGQTAYVGRDVLRGLIRGIDEAIEAPRRSKSRDLGPCLIGCAPWMNDPELLERLKRLSGACIVLTKKGRTKRDQEKLAELHQVNAEAPGLYTGAFPDLFEYAPRVDGEPKIVGPYDPMSGTVLPSIRTIGFRKLDDHLVPLMHAKLALLGELWWHDEDALGHVDDVYGFRPRRLWVSSANFTRASRRSLEHGFWTTDPQLVQGYERFLLKLVAASEGLHGEDEPHPELLPVEFDDEAMAEAAAEMAGDEDEEEGEDY